MKEIVKIPKDKLPKPRYRWMRNPVTKIKESKKGYNRASEKAKARRDIYEKG